MRLALLSDPHEEGWPSMDLCAEALAEHLTRDVDAEIVRPRFVRRIQRMPVVGGGGKAELADRLWCRFRTAPRAMRAVVGKYDAYHIVDHTYAHLALELPANKTGVYCHDLDAFRSVIDPSQDRKPAWFRRLVRRQIRGLQRARLVFHNSMQTRQELLAHNLVDPSRLVHAPLGVAAEFTPVSPAGLQSPAWLEELAETPYILHVGSCIPRKRIDILLRVFARLAAEVDSLTLLKIGGQWSGEQTRQIEELSSAPRIIHIGGVNRNQLAEAYRRARGVLITSESEGFGLPVVEALACGAPVVASDIPVLREVGGDAANYAAVGDIDAWVEAVERTLAGKKNAEVTSDRVQQADRFSWTRHAEIIAGAYRKVLA